MAGEIDEYTRVESEFLRSHWDGCDRQQVVEEINDWITWELNPVATEVIDILKETERRFHEQTVKALKKDWMGFDNRFVVSLDTSNVTKSPEKMLEKLGMCQQL